MTALRKHCQEPWILLYVERWLRAPMQSVEGQLQRLLQPQAVLGLQSRRFPLRLQRLHEHQ